MAETSSDYGVGAGESLQRTLFKLEVRETQRSRSFWVARDWAASVGSTDAVGADVLLVPWVNFRNEQPALFPQSTSAFFRALRDGLDGREVVILIDEDRYQEIALHADVRRLPTLFVTAVLAPLLISVAANYVSSRIFRENALPVVEMTMIVEGKDGRCLLFEYSGPSDRLAQALVDEIHHCFPESRSADERVEVRLNGDGPDKPARSSELRGPQD